MAQAAAAEPQDQFVLIVINVQNIKFTQLINLSITESDRHGTRNDFYLFIWLCWVLVAARGIFIASCGDLLSQLVDSLVVACGLSSCGRRVSLLCRMWDLNSPTRHRTHAPCIGSAEF